MAGQRRELRNVPGEPACSPKGDDRTSDLERHIRRPWAERRGPPGHGGPAVDLESRERAHIAKCCEPSAGHTSAAAGRPASAAHAVPPLQQKRLQEKRPYPPCPGCQRCTVRASGARAPPRAPAVSQTRQRNNTIFSPNGTCVLCERLKRNTARVQQVAT